MRYEVGDLLHTAYYMNNFCHPGLRAGILFVSHEILKRVQDDTQSSCHPSLRAGIHFNPPPEAV